MKISAKTLSLMDQTPNTVNYLDFSCCYKIELFDYIVCTFYF